MIDTERLTTALEVLGLSSYASAQLAHAEMIAQMLPEIDATAKGLFGEDMACAMHHCRSALVRAESLLGLPPPPPRVAVDDVPPPGVVHLHPPRDNDGKGGR